MMSHDYKPNNCRSFFLTSIFLLLQSIILPLDKMQLPTVLFLVFASLALAAPAPQKQGPTPAQLKRIKAQVAVGMSCYDRGDGIFVCVDYQGGDW